MTLATCAKDLKLYSWPDISLLGVYETSDDCVGIKSLSWCSEGKQLVLVKSNGHPAVIKAPQRIEENVQPFHHIKISATTVATFSNVSSDLIALGTVHGEIKLYDLKEKQVVGDYPKVPVAIQNIEYSHHDDILTAGCINGQIVAYNKDRDPCTSFSVPFSTSLTAMATHKFKPNLLAAASKEGVICIWDLESANSRMVGKHHSGVITDVAFSEDTVTTVSVDQNLIVSDLRVSDQVACYNLNCPLSSLSHCTGSHEIAVATCDGQLRSYDKRCMTSPLHTVVAYNAWIKKIMFPEVKMPGQAGNSGRFKTPEVRSNRHHHMDTLSEVSPASGDYAADNSNFLSKDSISELASGNDLMRSISEALLHVDEKITNEELKTFVRDIEKQIRFKKSEFEEKMLQKFYMMRIDASKQFIMLEERINENWNNFIDYLKHTGNLKKEKTKNKRRK